MTQHERPSLDTLPSDVLCEILSYCSPDDITRIGLVSSKQLYLVLILI